jgi:hypothetical protein
MADYQIAGIDELQLHHLYRAMAWLGEETAPAGRGGLAPRCVKDLIEERLFERRRDLFSDLSLVFIALSDQVKRALRIIPNRFTSVAVAGAAA